LRVGAPCKFGRFDKRPRQKLVAAFGVIGALLLLIGGAFGLDGAAITGIVPRLGEALISPTSIVMVMPKIFPTPGKLVSLA
jgi:hypothetical protein